MPDQEEKSAIHPVSIFKQAWSICWKNLGKLSAIYLIFNLPITVLSLSPMVRSLPDQKFSFAAVLWYLSVILINSWGHIALLLGADKAVGAQDYTIGQSISQAKMFFLKYLSAFLIVILFLMGVTILGGISVVMILAFLLQVNKMLAVFICLILAIVVLVTLVYFILRWFLATTVCVLENARPITALKRSFSLVKEHINPVVGMYGLMVLAYIVCLVPMIIAGGLLSVGKDASLASRTNLTIYVILINIALVPLWNTMMVVLYKKLKEALESHVHA